MFHFRTMISVTCDMGTQELTPSGNSICETNDDIDELDLDNIGNMHKILLNI